MISLLKDIRKELVIERKDKLRNALILATAIVMFAVPLNFMVEVSANYIDNSATGELVFDDFSSIYFWLFCFCMGLVLDAFYTFFLPIPRIFMDSFDWEIAFKDIEKKVEEDEYYYSQELIYPCPICDDEFESYRRIQIHEEDCRLKSPVEWKKMDEDLEEELEE